jgi:hypothetical protein
MNDTSSSAYTKLMEGKRRLARARNNPDMLDRALEFIDTALLEHLRSVFPSADIGPYHLFVHLQKDHIIDVRERGLISSMHSLRTKTAHANPRYLTQNTVERYATLAKTIMDRTASRKHMAARRMHRTSDSLRTQPERAADNRSAPEPPARYGSPSPTIESSPTDIPRPASSQHSLSHYHDRLRSEMREVELGRSKPDPLDS